MTLRESTKIATAVALCLLPSWILVLNTARGLSEPHIHSSVVCGNKIVGSGSGGDLMGMLDAIIQGYRCARRPGVIGARADDGALVQFGFVP